MTIAALVISVASLGVSGLNVYYIRRAAKARTALERARAVSR